MVIGRGDRTRLLSVEDICAIVAQALDTKAFDGKRVLALIPDQTRTCPVGFFFRLLAEELRPRTKRLDFIIALGTHPQMPAERVDALLEMSAAERGRRYPDVEVLNHAWDDPTQLAHIGTISADDVERISEGLLREEVPICINRRVLGYDVLLVVGPVFPHEVVGFSGGNKYLFPGIAGPEVLNFFHWLGALITNVRINGTKQTPVRAVVDRAAAAVPAAKLCFAMVTTKEGVQGLYFGDTVEAWSAAADLASQVHIVYREHPYKRILGLAPAMYDDIWTAGKVMYKLEPVLADGGELIIHAPHIREISYTHGRHLDRVGYHCRDYFLKQMERFRDIPRAVLAHSTHVKGLGRFENGVETPRATVVLATGIPEERCRRVNLGYRDPATIDPAEWEGREDEGYLLVRDAGEVLYRLTGGRLPMA
jgi:nickel-dependent lactate racemase